MTQGFMTTKEAAIALLSHTTGQGPVNGSFATKLIEAFSVADIQNTGRLLKGFPEFDEPLRVIQYEGSDFLEQGITSGRFDAQQSDVVNG